MLPTPNLVKELTRLDWGNGQRLCSVCRCPGYPKENGLMWHPGRLFDCRVFFPGHTSGEDSRYEVYG